jgi:hypothetical protein
MTAEQDAFGRVPGIASGSSSPGSVPRNLDTIRSGNTTIVSIAMGGTKTLERDVRISIGHCKTLAQMTAQKVRRNPLGRAMWRRLLWCLSAVLGMPSPVWALFEHEFAPVA